MRLVVDADDPRSLDPFGREIAQTGTSWATGTTHALVPGRQKAAPIIRMFSCGAERKGYPEDRHRWA
jgi:hypothetical protein